MSTLDSKSLDLSPEQSSFLEHCVASGRYASASEVVREGLRLLAHEEARRQASLAQARQMIETGAQELDRDEVVDSESVFRRLRARRERMKRGFDAQP